MFHHRFVGSAAVNGSERRVAIAGSPVGRTVIQVDGVTVYDKKPFIHKETLDFEIIPGKKATLRWQQVSVKGFECDLTVDGKTTALATMATDGSLNKSVGGTRREQFNIRAVGAGLAAMGVIALLINYMELNRGGYYYPKLIFAAPLLLVNGLIGLSNPEFISLSTPARRNSFLVLQGVLIVFGWWFTGWFVNAFGSH